MLETCHGAACFELKGLFFAKVAKTRRELSEASHSFFYFSVIRLASLGGSAQHCGLT